MLINYRKGLSKYITDIDAPTLESGALDLGLIHSNESSTVFGKFIFNAADHPSGAAGPRKLLLEHGELEVELLVPGSGEVAYHTKVEQNGQFSITGVAEGTWDLRYKNPAAGYVSNPQQVVTLPGATTTVFPGSVAVYDAGSHGAVMTNFEPGTSTITVADLTRAYQYQVANVKFIDDQGGETSLTPAYLENLSITIPSGAVSVEVSYQYDDGAGNFSYSPIFKFTSPLIDTDSDLVVDALDCAPDDNLRFQRWHGLVEDKDGDNYFSIPNGGVCAGSNFPENHARANVTQVFDCDDNNPQKKTGQTLKDETTEAVSYICAGPGNDIPQGYNAYYPVVRASQFETSPDKPDIFYISTYGYDENIADAGEVKPLPLQKRTSTLEPMIPCAR